MKKKLIIITRPSQANPEFPDQARSLDHSASIGDANCLFVFPNKLARFDPILPALSIPEICARLEAFRDTFGHQYVCVLGHQSLRDFDYIRQLRETTCSIFDQDACFYQYHSEDGDRYGRIGALLWDLICKRATEASVKAILASFCGEPADVPVSVAIYLDELVKDAANGISEDEIRYRLSIRGMASKIENLETMSPERLDRLKIMLNDLNPNDLIATVHKLKSVLR